jgi:hypothetical protein
MRIAMPYVQQFTLFASRPTAFVLLPEIATDAVCVVCVFIVEAFFRFK